MMKLLPRLVLALAVAGAANGVSAQGVDLASVNRAGPYLVAAVGRNQYDYDCWFWATCETARSNSGKVVAGFRFGVFGIEGSWIDFGRAEVNDGRDALRLRSVALNGVWYGTWGPAIEGLLRAGIADVQHTRTGDGRKSNFSGVFGLGLVLHLSQQIAVEAAWDVTGAEGNDTGSTTGSALSLGLRVRF